MNMKKFSLKPLGDSCIKKLCKSWFFIGLIMAFCVSACSDDDDNVVTPKFPEKQNIICNSGETKEFTFEANTNWSLTSSSIWCKFQKDGVEEYILSGAAGKQTVTIVVTADDQPVDKASVAKLELTMGGQSIVIGEITRSAKNYELKIYDEAGNEINELEVGYGEYIPFKVKANFRFAATNLPNWVELQGGSLVGVTNQEVKGGLKIIEDGSREKYPVVASENNVVIFSDEAGKAFYSFKVSYKGMTPGKIDLTRLTTNPYDWTVTLDGKSFAQTGNTTASAKNRLPVTIKTLNDDYEIVFANIGWDNKLHIIGTDKDYWATNWMSYEYEEGNKGNVSIIVDEYIRNADNMEPEERTGYILAFSRAEYESIKDNLEENIIDEESNDIAYKYQGSNLIIAFTQKEAKAETGKNSFLVKKAGYIETPCNEVTDASVLSFLKQNYNIDDVYSITAEAGDYFTINPLLSESDWTNEAYVIDIDDNTVNVSTEAGADDAGAYFAITLPEPFKQNIFIIFKGTDGLYKKALMITYEGAEIGGGESTSIFNVTAGYSQTPIACTLYNNEFGDESWLKSNYKVADIWVVNEPSKDSGMSIKAKNDITSVKCYNFDQDSNNEMTFDLNDSGSDVYFNNTTPGETEVNMWLGDGTSINYNIGLVIIENYTPHLLIFKVTEP